MRIGILLLAMVTGCASYRAAIRESDEREAAAERAQLEQQKKDQQARKQAQAWENYYERTCTTPPDQAWLSFCAQRSAALAQAKHDEYARQQDEDAARRARIGDAIQAAGDAYQAPYRQPPKNCTSVVTGNIVTTNCY